MFCAVSGWALPQKRSSWVAVAALDWLPVEALLTSFEHAHGDAGLASHSDPIWDPPLPSPAPIQTDGLLLDGHLGQPGRHRVGATWEHALERDVVGQVGRDHFGEKG